MKRIIAISGLLGVLGLGVVTAQVVSKDSKVTELKEGKKERKDHHKADRKKGAKENRFEKYNLTETQKTQLKALFEKNKPAKDAVKDQNLTQEQRQKMHEEKRATMDKEIQKILTKDQYTQFQKDQADRKANGKEHKKGRHGKGMKGDFLAKYNLTDAQKTELKTYFEQTKTAKDGVKKENLTQEQREKMHKERKAAFDKKMQTVLTKEQYAQFKKDQTERDVKHSERIEKKVKAKSSTENKVGV